MSNVVQCGDVKDVLRQWVSQGVRAQHGRHYRLIELNPEYCKLIDQRLYGDMFS
jgi:hypothetical protein